MFIILAFTFSIILGLLYYGFSEIETRMLESASDIQEQLSGAENVTQIVQNTFGRFRQATESFKWIGVMLILGLFISVIIHSFIVNTKPIYWISYLFIWMLSYILSVPISNAYETIYLNPSLAEAFVGFTGQNYLMLNLPTITLVLGFIAGVVLFINFVRVRSGSGYQ